jgi:hypothetical protein
VLTFQGAGGQFWCSAQAWAMMARLARDRGWVPEGVPEPVDDGPRSDFAPDHWDYNRPGIVLAIPDHDARTLADALESVLPDLPRFDALEEKALCHLDLPGSLPVRVIRPGAAVSPYEFFSGSNRQALERFIALCRAGSLTVR